VEGDEEEGGASMNSEFQKVECGDGCHPIQWPYDMKGCYPKLTALQDCADETKSSNGTAFSSRVCVRISLVISYKCYQTVCS